MNFINVIKSNLQFYLILLVITIAGSVVGEIALLLSAGFLYLFWQNRKFGLALQLLFFVLVLSDNLEMGTRWAGTYKPVLVMLMSLFVLVFNKEFRGVNNKIFRLFLPYIAVATLCLYFSPIFFTGIQKTLSYALVFFCVPIVATYEFQTRGKEFAREMVVFVVLIVFSGIILRYIMPEVAISHGGRMRGIFGNPNGLGIYLIVITGFIFACRRIFSNLFTNREYLFIALLVLYASYVSGSRTSLMVLLLFFVSIRISQISPWVSLLVTIILAFSFTYLLELGIGIINAFGLGEQFRVDTIQEGSGRLIAWEYAWENIKKDSFFLGKGMGWDERLMIDARPILSRRGHEGGVHNSYLIIWLNTGIIGLILFLRGFLLSFIQAAKNSVVALPFMYGVAISIMVEPWIAASLNPFTSMFLLSIVMMNYYSVEKVQEMEEEEEEEMLNEELEGNALVTV